MARYTCKRCKADCNTLDEPHLCKDLKKRYERQHKAIALIMDIFYKYDMRPHVDPFDPISKEDIAAEIVKAIGSRHLGVDD